MARPLWKGSIGFGLITIPVEIHTAVRDPRPRFRLLHGKDLSPIRMDPVCQQEGAPIGGDDLVKGYEYEPGRYVVVSAADFQTAAPRKTRVISVLDFVDVAAIDDRYFETPYYLVPGKGGERGYALLREALRAAGKAGLCKIILRDAQHLAALVVVKDALVLALLRFADELRDLGEFDFPSAAEVGAEDLALARRLVDSLAGPFTPERYADEYRHNLLRIIQAKVQGEKPRLEEPARSPREAEVISLMERLRRSLEEAEEAAPHKRPRERRHRASA